MGKRHQGLFALGIAAIFAAATPTQAQVTPAVEAEQLQQRFAPQLQAPALPQLDGFPSTGTPNAPNSFVLQGVQFEGNTAIDDAVLASLFTDRVGQRFTPDMVTAAVALVTQYYKGQGYALSRAYLPPQALQPTGAVLRIGIVEGYIDRVQVPASLQKYRDFFSQYNQAITASQPLQSEVLERYLQLMNRLPGLSFRAVLEQSRRNQFASTLNLEVTEEPNDASLTVDNRGSDENGREQYRLDFTLNNPTNGYDRLTGSFALAGVNGGSGPTAEFKYGYLGYERVLNAAGTVLEITGTASESTPEDAALQALEFESRSKSLAVDVSHPLYLTNRFQLEAGLGFDLKSSESETLGNTSQKDELRVLRAYANFGYQDDLGGSSQGRLMVSKGIDGLGSTENGSALHSRASGEVDFTKVVLEGTRWQTLPGPFSARTRGFYQWTDDPLLSAEECGYGGAVFGRAFASSALVGERCTMFSVEGQYDLGESTGLAGSEAYAFYDFGRVTNLTGTTTTRDQASTAGVGLRFSADRLSGEIEYARSLEEPNGITDTQDRFNAAVSLRF